MDDDSYDSVKYTVGIICSSLSLAFIITLYVLYWIKPSSHDNAFFRMVVHMELPNLLYAITGLITYPARMGEFYCEISGALRQYCLISTSTWALLIAYHIKTSIADHEIRPFSFKYVLIGYGVPLPFAGIPIYLDRYTVTALYCGLPLSDWAPYMLAHSLPLFTCLLGTCYCYFSVISYLHKSISKEAAREFYPLLVYPILIVACYIGDFTYLVLELTGNHLLETNSVMIIIWIGILQAQGLLDVVVYSMNYAIREEVKMKLCPSKVGELEADFDPTFKSRMGTMDFQTRNLPESHSVAINIGEDTRDNKSMSFFEIDQSRKDTSMTI